MINTFLYYLQSKVIENLFKNLWIFFQINNFILYIYIYFYKTESFTLIQYKIFYLFINIYYL